MRVFSAGATRDSNEGKLAYNRFLSPRVLESLCIYLEKHRETANGYRDQDNWKSGIPIPVYLESLSRHYHELWTLTENGIELHDTVQEAINACLFNLMGLSHELIKQRDLVWPHIPSDMGDSGRTEHETSSEEIRSRVRSLYESYKAERDATLAPKHETAQEMCDRAGSAGSNGAGVPTCGCGFYPEYIPKLSERPAEAIRDQYDE